MAARHRNEIDVLGWSTLKSSNHSIDRRGNAPSCFVRLNRSSFAAEDYAIVEQDSPGIMGMRNSQET